jgi:DNA-binding MarR family transcriptional regulator
VIALSRYSRLVTQQLDRILRPLDLTFARYEILMLLSFSGHGALPITRIGDLLQVHPTSISSAMDRLVAFGFAERVPDLRDGRVVQARITSRGRDQAVEATTRVNTEVFGSLGISSEQLQMLRSVLRAFRVNAGDFAGSS